MGGLYESPFDSILSLPFVDQVTGAAVKIAAALGDKAANVKAVFNRDPDEHEFFMLNVGASISHLLTLCEHLRVIPILLTNYRTTPSMTKMVVTRHTHVVFHIEGYLIRVQGVLDRALKLINAAFHLCNSDRNCTEHVLLKNAKVEHHAEVGVAFKALKKAVDRYRVERNEVVHAKHFMEQRLRHAELYDVVARSRELDGDPSAKDLMKASDELVRELASEKKWEFETFNVELARHLKALFEALAPIYAAEEVALRLRLGKP
jgi:hypothetical protein